MPIECYRKILEQSDEEERRLGLSWYKERSREVDLLSLETGYSREQVAGVIAVLSPLVEWNINFKYARNLLRSRGKSRGPGFKRNKDKALSILRDNNLECIRGPKVKAFYETLLNPNYGEPVIDTQMIAAFYNGKAYRDDFKIVSQSKRRMEPIRKSVKLLARENKKTVANIQAQIWLTFKRLNGPYAEQLKLWR